MRPARWPASIPARRRSRGSSASEHFRATSLSPKTLYGSSTAGAVVGRYETGVPLNGVAVGGDAVWAISGSSASVLRIDPRTGKVTARIAIVASRRTQSPYPIALAVGLGSVWVL